jgi:hypothetical protein
MTTTPADLSTFKKRDAWICRVMGEPLLTVPVRFVAVRLALHHNCAIGRCDPRHQALAKELCISKRSVIRGIATLEKRGWIVVERNVSGTHAGNQILFLDPPTGDTILSPVGVTTVCHPLKGGRVTNSTGTGDKPGMGRVTYAVTPNNNEENSEENSEGKSQTPTSESELFTDASSQNLIPNDLTAERPLRSLSRRKNLKASVVTIDAAFDCFWAAYPKRVARGAARKAFAAAIKAGTDPEEIIEGARRFCTERAGADPRYTAHPATWLNGERWTDESAARPNGSGPVTLDNETGRPIEPQHHAEGDRNYRTGGRPATFSEIAAQREMERRRG